MFGRLRVYLDQFFEQRIEDIATYMQMENAVIKSLKEELREQEKVIISKLDEEGKKAFLAYESAHSGIEGLMRSKLYKQGFFDGMKAVRLFNR